MHVEEMTQEMHQFFDRCYEVARRKNRDYHPDKVAMLEILQTAWETGVTVEQDLWGRVRKQLSALRNFVIDNKVESEPPQHRCQDIANYMAIMNFWLENKDHIIRDAYAFITTNRPCEQPCHDHSCDTCKFAAWLGNHCAA